MEAQNQKRNAINSKSGIIQSGSGFKYLLLIAILIIAACTNRDTAHEHETYTCPMHPTVVADRPGTCPVCGMDLVRKARPGEEVEITEDIARLLKSPGEVIVSSVRTISGQYKSLPVAVQAQGIVTYDTRNIYTIPARVGGRLEKVFLKFPFQSVSKGQKIAEIYSPELITAQRELLYLSEHDPDNTSLINGAKARLELLGMSSRQIDDLIRRKQAKSTFAVYSPYAGYVITDTPVPSATVATASPASTGSGMADGMGSAPSGGSTSSPSTQSSRSGLLVREGDYINAGQNLFTIVNNDALRIELNVPGIYSRAIAEGSKVELSFGEGRSASATIDFVQPFFAEAQEFLKVRVYTRETEGLPVGHLVSATLHLETTEALWVPREAVLDLGLKKVVFLKNRGVFKPKEVLTGSKADGMIEIVKGLASSDEIAADAHFMVDSEGFVNMVN